MLNWYSQVLATILLQLKTIEKMISLLISWTIKICINMINCHFYPPCLEIVLRIMKAGCRVSLSPKVCLYYPQEIEGSHRKLNPCVPMFRQKLCPKGGKWCFKLLVSNHLGLQVAYYLENMIFFKSKYNTNKI